jgi:hypothetical protein
MSVRKAAHGWCWCCLATSLVACRHALPHLRRSCIPFGANSIVEKYDSVGGCLKSAFCTRASAVPSVPALASVGRSMLMEARTAQSSALQQLQPVTDMLRSSTICAAPASWVTAHAAVTCAVLHSTCQPGNRQPDNNVEPTHDSAAYDISSRRHRPQRVRQEPASQACWCCCSQLLRKRSQ